jgi:hypothetical protein
LWYRRRETGRRVGWEHGYEGERGYIEEMLAELVSERYYTVFTRFVHLVDSV